MLNIYVCVVYCHALLYFVIYLLYIVICVESDEASCENGIVEEGEGGCDCCILLMCVVHWYMCVVYWKNVFFIV